MSGAGLGWAGQGWAGPALRALHVLSPSIHLDDSLVVDAYIPHIHTHTHNGSYGVHMVVANLLQTRYKEIQLVEALSISSSSSPSMNESAAAPLLDAGAGAAVAVQHRSQTVAVAPGEKDLEASFVPLVAQAHYAFISESDSPYGRPPPLRPLPTPSMWQRLRSVDLADLCLALVLGPGVVVLSVALQRRVLARLLKE